MCGTVVAQMISHRMALHRLVRLVAASLPLALQGTAWAEQDSDRVESAEGPSSSTEALSSAEALAGDAWSGLPTLALLPSFGVAYRAQSFDGVQTAGSNVDTTSSDSSRWLAHIDLQGRYEGPLLLAHAAGNNLELTGAVAFKLADLGLFADQDQLLLGARYVNDVLEAEHGFLGLLGMGLESNEVRCRGFLQLGAHQVTGLEPLLPLDRTWKEALGIEAWCITDFGLNRFALQAQLTAYGDVFPGERRLVLASGETATDFTVGRASAALRYIRLLSEQGGVGLTFGFHLKDRNILGVKNDQSLDATDVDSSWIRAFALLSGEFNF